MTDDASPVANRPWALVAILVLFLSTAVLYNLNTPVYEAPDELQHAAFVVWLAEGKGLPVVDPTAPGPWEQEGTQPPLYYWLATTLVGQWSGEEAGSLARLNPYAGIGDPQRPDNKNRVLHDWERERWPYQGSTGFVHLARGISTLMALGTLLALYRLGRFVFPERAGIALGMVGLVAFTPQFLSLSASINNDNLVILIAAWALVILARWLRAPRPPTWLSLAGLGMLLGLAVLAKYSGLLLWPLAAGTILWLAWREKRLRWLIPAGLLVFGLALAVSGWWFVRNQQLYGDLSALGPHLEIMGTRRRTPSAARFTREFNGFRYSFWALFGWFNILVPDPFYWIMDALTVLGIAGLGVFLVRSFRHLAPATRHILVMLMAWLVLVAAGVLHWTLTTPASQGRLLYPAWPAIALLLVVGWAELVPRRPRRPVSAAVLAAWVLWAMLCPLLFIKPAYALPLRAQSLDELSFEPTRLQVRYQGCCELVGYVVPDEPVYPGDWMPLTLVWRALEPMEQDYSLFIHATAPDGQVAGQLDTYHGGGMYQTSQWQPGEIIADTVNVPISWKAEGPALLRFNVGLHRDAGSERLPAFGPDGKALEIVFAGEAALIPFSWPEPEPDPQVDTLFGQEIRLVGIDLPQDPIHPGEVVTITLQWEAVDRIREDYVGFIHLVGPAGQDVAQDDHPPQNGNYPTRLWFPGAIVLDPYRLKLADDLEPGTYELWAGLYRPESGERLPAIAQGTGQSWQDDLVYIGALVITARER
jgi:4-amino-4-deoxy-L-arabinose transferase-like glycosyltransferase